MSSAYAGYITYPLTPFGLSFLLSFSPLPSSHPFYHFIPAHISHSLSLIGCQDPPRIHSAVYQFHFSFLLLISELCLGITANIREFFNSLLICTLFIMDFYAFDCAGRRVLLPLDALPIGYTYLVGITGLLPPTAASPHVAGYIVLLGDDVHTPASQLGVPLLVSQHTGLTLATTSLARVDGVPLAPVAPPVVIWQAPSSGSTVATVDPTSSAATFHSAAVSQHMLAGVNSGQQSFTTAPLHQPNDDFMPHLDWEGGPRPSSTSSIRRTPSSTSSHATSSARAARHHPYRTSRPSSAAGAPTESAVVGPSTPASGSGNGGPMFFQLPSHSATSPHSPSLVMQLETISPAESEEESTDDPLGGSSKRLISSIIISY